MFDAAKADCRHDDLVVLVVSSMYSSGAQNHGTVTVAKERMTPWETIVSANDVFDDIVWRAAHMLKKKLV